MAQWQRSVFGIGKSRVRLPNGFVSDLFEPHSKNHSKGAKIPQIHSKYSKFRMCTSLITQPAQTTE